MLDRLEGVANGIAIAIITAIGSGIWWLVRRVFTNQKQLELLEAEMKRREDARREDRDRMTTIETDVRDIKRHIMDRK